MEFSLNSIEVLYALFAALISLVFMILIWRFYLRRYEKKEDELTSPQPSQRTKYAEYDVFRKRFTLLQLGMLFSLSFTLITLSWTSYEPFDIEPEEPYVVDDIVEVIPPRTYNEPPKLVLPTVKAPPIIEVSDVIAHMEKPKLLEATVEQPTMDQKINLAQSVKTPKAVVVAPPPPPAEPVFDIPEIFEIVEEMPRFPGCEDLAGSIADKKKCADEKLMRYLYKNLKYPSIARENSVEGRLYVRFIVEKDGSISNTEIIRDIGAGCGEAALKVIEKMNNLPLKWAPGKQRNTPVRVKYTLPVTFKLNN